MIVASVAYVVRHPGTVTALLADPQTVVVIDEVHHAVAESYRRILDPLLGRTPRRLLGLTATPTRTLAWVRPMLGRHVRKSQHLRM